MKDVKTAALANLKKYGVKTVLIPTLVEGLNDDEIGEIFDYAFSEPFIQSLHIQTLTHTGVGETFKFDPMNHITNTDVLSQIERHYKNKINRYDFVPEPSECFLTGVFLNMKNCKPVPIYRYINMTKYLDKIQNGQVLSGSEINSMIKVITKNYIAGLFKKGIKKSKIEHLPSLIKFGCMVFGLKIKYKEKANVKILSKMEENLLLVNFHSMMDKFTFDQKRVMECVHQWITDDEITYPFCSYSMIHCDNIKKKLYENWDAETIESSKKAKELKEKFMLQ